MDWSFLGGRWSKAAEPPAGFPTAFAGAAYDNDINSIALFGGLVDTAPAGDLWTFDGRKWTKRDAPSGPAPRAHPAVAYDERNGALVVFGGADRSGASLGDTWTWTAYNGWRQVGAAGA
jgi:hypothetical protein